MVRRYPNLLTFVALTDFAKSRFVADGFPAKSFVVRGNVMADPGAGEPRRDKRIVFVGRLSSEKGVDTLVRAAKAVDGEIEIIGDGPQRKMLEAMAGANVRFLGALPPPASPSAHQIRRRVGHSVPMV